MKHPRLIPAVACMLALGMLFCAGCDRFPRDPRSSLERALDRGTLRVGVSEARPWVVRQADGSAGGLEGVLIAEFAEELGVEVEWRWASAEDHFEALKAYELDVVIAGLTAGNPWKKHAGFTMPYFTSRSVVGVDASMPTLDNLDGVSVAYRAGSGLGEKIESRGGVAVERDHLAESSGVVAAERWEILGLGLADTGIELRSKDRVMAVPQGENALLIRLEGFLMDRSRASDSQRRMRGALWEWSGR